MKLLSTLPELQLQAQKKSVIRIFHLIVSVMMHSISQILLNSEKKVYVTVSVSTLHPTLFYLFIHTLICQMEAVPSCLVFLALLYCGVARKPLVLSGPHLGS